MTVSRSGLSSGIRYNQITLYIQQRFMKCTISKCLHYNVQKFIYCSNYDGRSWRHYFYSIWAQNWISWQCCYPPTNIVTHVYVQQLMDLQHSTELRVAHKLQACHTSPSHYEQMRVCLAAQFFSRSTAAAVETAVKLGLLPNEALNNIQTIADKHRTVLGQEDPSTQTAVTVVPWVKRRPRCFLSDCRHKGSQINK